MRGLFKAIRCRLASWIAPKGEAFIDVRLLVDDGQVEEELDRVCSELDKALRRKQARQLDNDTTGGVG